MTRPTDAMREAMARAEVGDDVYGEDPTVARLEAYVAELLGMESALFVPSGTMANQIALMLHCRPGDAVFCGAGTHLVRYESGAAAAFAGGQFFPTASAMPEADEIAEMVFPDAYYYPRPRLLALENTHNHSGGRIYPRERFAGAVAAARAKGLGVHLDGARLWNAAAAQDLEPAALCAGVDTVSVCFSKGLGAPLGSALAFSADRRQEALRYRRRMGGALRQSGIVAAAALYGLEHHRDDLESDHRRARELASGLGSAGYACQPVETNMVVFEVRDAHAFVEAAAPQVQLGAISPTKIRAVTHRDLSDADLAQAIEALSALASEWIVSG
ncbi:MAG: GntG family PLP-dependent aldolase [Myxococcota bacterium]